MAIYPDLYDRSIGTNYVYAAAPFDHSEYYSVLITEFENGSEQRRLLQATPKRIVRLNYSPIKYSDAIIIKEFYSARRGSFESFAFYYPQLVAYTKEYVGVADTGDNRLLLPSNNAGTYTLYRNNVALTETTEYTIAIGAGGDGEDLATLNFSSIAGDVYHFSFTGYLKIKARFSNDPFGVNDMKTILSGFSVVLESLVNEGCYQV